MAHKKGNIAHMKDNMALIKGIHKDNMAGLALATSQKNAERFPLWLNLCRPFKKVFCQKQRSETLNYVLLATARDCG